jgi:hypothetical protein
VVAYIADLNLKAFASSSISTYVSAVSYVHKLHNWADPTGSFIVSKMKEGCRRLDPRQDSRCPITFPVLISLVGTLPSVCKTAYEALLFKAAFLLALFGFLRVSEFTSTKRMLANSRALCIGDISFNQEGNLQVVLRYSKTDQVGYASIISIDRNANTELCPVQTMTQFLEARPPREGLLFVHFFFFFGGGPFVSQTS